MSTIRVRAQISEGITTVRALISHPMESGRRRDEQGQLVPAHYITEVNATVNGEHVITAYWGPAVARDPHLSFKFSGAKAGDQLNIRWQDNRGQQDSAETTIS
ncbi:thiosulfate oxidation carrier complex protein SoxZ [Thiorhodospira sibirica]|uniref:thiosulfate oxidation carrier complex protein SoxZ n=1 Tax=Thiorhodospira sibirica TaxID=154347 RepID=UPI00022C10FD|nr:thiosulfate oxidation carrier complex protein SoxZ [Thiorhodospira sibirica]